MLRTNRTRWSPLPSATASSVAASVIGFSRAVSPLIGRLSAGRSAGGKHSYYQQSTQKYGKESGKAAFHRDPSFGCLFLYHSIESGRCHPFFVRLAKKFFANF